MKIRVLILISLLLMPSVASSTYTIPSDRTVTWAGNAGLDPVGGIPNYTSVTCTGVHADNTTDDAAHIQTCINSASANTAVYLPAGTYLASSQNITLKDNVVLRGAGASSTEIRLTNGYRVIIGAENKTFGSEVAITSGYTKDSTQLTLASVSGLAVGGWISVTQSNDPTSMYGYSGCGWCGEDSGDHIVQQFVKITAINDNTITIDPPVYYVTASPPSPSIKPVTFAVKYAGVENLKINGSGTSSPPLNMYKALYSWGKGVDVYYTGGQEIVGMHFSHGLEFRDSSVHRGANYTSGQTYGIKIMWWNSNHKIENNIIYDTRHSIVFESGGKGVAVLYNFTDNNYESDSATDWLPEDAIANHNVHPSMNLWEGNEVSNLVADDVHGSSAYGTWFRNHSRAAKSFRTSNEWLVAFEVQHDNDNYNLVGNVAGLTSWGSNGAGVKTGNCSFTSTYNYGYAFGCINFGTYGDNVSRSSAIMHGNYDFITDSVVNWDGGADHTIANSLYYNAKPSWWCSETPWPPIGPDVTGYYNDIPAKRRAQGDACTLSSSAITITSPIDNAVAEWPVDFTWSAVDNAILYHIQIDDNSDFSSPEIDDDEVDPAACDETDCHYLVGIGEGLLPSRHYYWRVRYLK